MVAENSEYIQVQNMVYLILPELIHNPKSIDLYYCTPISRWSRHHTLRQIPYVISTPGNFFVVREGNLLGTIHSKQQFLSEIASYFPSSY